MGVGVKGERGDGNGSGDRGGRTPTCAPSQPRQRYSLVKHEQPHERQLREEGSWASWPCLQRQGARHECTSKPLRRGSHHMPHSSGREGTKSKRLQAHEVHAGGCGLDLLTALWALSAWPQKQRESLATREQSAPLFFERHTMYTPLATALWAPRLSACIIALAPGATP